MKFWQVALVQSLLNGYNQEMNEWRWCMAHNVPFTWTWPSASTLLDTYSALGKLWPSTPLGKSILAGKPPQGQQRVK